MAVSQTIATIPQAPSRADPANFVTRHEAVLDRLETLPPEMNTWRDQVNNTQSQINASELQAGQSATTATNAASLALTYSNAEQYSAGATYAPGETTIGSNGTAYRRLNTSAAGDNPVTSTTGNWTPAITALGAMSTFDLICRIAGMQPTLYLNFKDQDYRHYSSTKGLEKKALADILTFTRGSDGGIFNARGQYEALSTDEPRLDFDPETGVGRGLLVEESRTNLLTYSEQFDNADWVKASATVTANAAVAPDGTLTADKLVETLGGAVRWCYQFAETSTASDFVLSGYFKAAERSIVELRIGDIDFDSGARAFATFDLSTGSFISSGGLDASISKYEIDQVGYGFYRISIYCILPVTGTTTTASFALRTHGSNANLGESYTGDGTSGLYLWGAQLEEGAFPTSYIPTTTAALERAADVASITGTTFSDFWNPTESTMMVIGAAVSGGLQASVYIDAFNRVEFSEYLDLPARVRADGIYCNLDEAHTLNESIHNKIIALKANDCAGAINGHANALSTQPSSIPAFTQIGVGFLNYAGGINFANKPQKMVVVFPRRLSDATLQQLSALGA